MQNQTKPKLMSFLRKQVSNHSYLLPFSLLLLFSFTFSLLTSTTIVVDINGTGNYTQINEAVQASADGDTIKIMPGIYGGNILIENRNNLTIASLYHCTEQDSFRYNTIIDGNDEDFGFRIIDSQFIKTIGLTITNCWALNPYNFSYGGGCFINKSQNILIEKCIIEKNNAGGGGGISVDSNNNENASLVELKGNIIKNNFACGGGGIYVARYSNVSFNNETMNSIYYNYSPIGSDIFMKTQISNSIIIDTFSVSEQNMNFQPYFYYDYYNNSDITINNYKIELYDYNVYVNPINGNNTNNGTIDEPLKTIEHALLMAKSQLDSEISIFLNEGNYDYKGIVLPFKNNQKLIGLGDEEVIINFNNKESYILFSQDSFQTIKNIEINNVNFLNFHSKISTVRVSYPDNIVFDKVKFENPIVYHEVLYFYESDNSSSLIEVNNSMILNKINGRHLYSKNINFNINKSIFNNSIYNSWDEGSDCCSLVFTGDRYSETPSILNIIDSQITNNEAASNWPGNPGAVTGISTGVNSNVNIVNCTISENEGVPSYYNSNETGKAIMFSKEDSHVNIINSIIYGNDEYDIGLNQGDYYPNENYSLNVINSIVGNHAMDLTDSRINFENVANIDPEFCGVDSLYPFALTQNSLAIDTGTTDVSQYLGEDFEFPEFDLAGNPRISGSTIDMGCYEYQQSNVAEENQIQEVKPIELSCYPNPFNLSSNGRSACVNISFSIQTAGNVELDIYNIKGQKVKSLIKAYTVAGNQTVIWDGKDEAGNKVSSGQYYTKLAIGNDVVAKKMLIIK